MQEFEKLVASGSKRMGKLLGNMLKKQYPNLHPGNDIFISLDELLQWNLWPNFINTIVYGELLKTLSNVLCACIISTIGDVCTRLHYKYNNGKHVARIT